MVRYLPDGYVDVVRAVSATVARTDTTAKDLFELPGNAVILGWFISGAASDAGTAATLDVGNSDAGDAYVDGADVKAGGTLQVPAATGLGALGGDPADFVQVTATYAETGTASEDGGPWTVTCLYHA